MRNMLKMRVSLVLFAIAVAPLAAPLLAAGHPLTALLIRSFFSRLCHQNLARSFWIEGSPVAVCVRCLGIYCGAAIGVLPGMKRDFAGRLFAVALLVNALDAGTGALHWHGNLPWPRFLFGLLLGIGTGALVCGPATAPFRMPGRLPGLR